jgi:NADPH:quinone reductase-like Zn-dependent oxidoreductase
VVPVVVKPDPARLEELGREVARGELSIPIGRRFTLSQIQEASELAEAGGIGKIVLTP